MPLQSGTKLGPYEILTALGAGGMGEVYRASDTRLNRTVAIKVLPPHFSNNLEMKQRFDREAQVIAGLNHPHICTLYDVGRQGETDFLVMEYLEGETLAQRLERGALPLDEALKVAIAIADALEKAHSLGVTHRDLKPGNIMITASGAKLLDFGLAKLKQAPQTADAAKTSASVNLSGTAPGIILGTLQYMAPEQLEGKEADARTDIFAAGSVLYEMVSGKRAFEGKSQPHLIAAIITTQPEPISKTHPEIPPALDFLVQRCLAKDPEERLQTATDLSGELLWLAGGGAEGTGPTPIASNRKLRVRLLQTALAALSLVVILLATITFLLPARGASRDENRFLISVPDMPLAEAMSVSPDGRWVAYSATDSSTSALFVRPVNVEVPQKLAATEGAGRLFWSPDSKWIGFFAGGKLKKIEAAGGPPQNICETADVIGGTWNADGAILFASSKGLQRVAAAGGDPSAVAVAGESPREPFFLPDGRHFLFVAGKDSGAAVYAGSLDSKDVTRLVSARSAAVYADPGYLLYQRDGTLYAQPFSASKLAMQGEAIRVADKLPFSPAGASPFSASNTGVLAFRNDPPQGSTGGNAGTTVPDRPLRWVNRNGTSELLAAPGGWEGPDLSPDGKRAAIHRHDADGGDVWIFTAGQSTPSKLTFDASQDSFSPVWSPDGTRIAFASHRNGKAGLYVKVADNTRNEELLLESDLPIAPMSWSGDRLVYWTLDPKTAGDIWMLTLTGDKKPAPILQTRADERNPQVSPDGKWMAYSSNETGRSEVYIRPFPDGPGKIQVSVNGGVYPRWRRDGKELYFMSLVSIGSMMVSGIHVSGVSIDREVPHALYQSFFLTTAHARGQYNAFAVSADGQRFLVPHFESLREGFGGGRTVAAANTAAASAALTTVMADRHAATNSASPSMAPITVVLNWTASLKP
jgi:Tol biopolymer transport system component